jgi:hypothetical protein
MKLRLVFSSFWLLSDFEIRLPGLVVEYFGMALGVRGSFIIFTWTPHRELSEGKASSHRLHTKLGLSNSWG